jgi:o-succinylbenzoate---CoA ligase
VVTASPDQPSLWLYAYTMSSSTPAPTLSPVAVPGGNVGVKVIIDLLLSAPDPDRSLALMPTYGPARFQQRLRSQLQLTPPMGASLCCPTSGSTATPRMVVIPRHVLTTAARARDAAMGGPAAWFLGVPPVTAGGLIAIERGVRSPVHPQTWDGAGITRFDVEEFTAQSSAFVDTTEAASVPARVSLVATQVDRLLRNPSAARNLARFDRVLVGGGPVAGATLSAAIRAGVRIISSYGATETCGGCVYDGVAVPGTAIRLVAGEIQVHGDSIAAGYLDGPLRLSSDGWWCSGDRGHVAAGRLQVTGRFDDIVTVKGTNVDVSAVQRLLAHQPTVQEVAVVATPADSGGHQLTAFVVGEVIPLELRSLVGAELGAAAIPRITVVSNLPLTASGKIDTQRLREDV